MDRGLFAIVICALLFTGMVCLADAGHWLSRRRARLFSEPPDSMGAVTGAIFALLGLLIAFTFSGAFSRFDDRRSIIVEEYNDISTAYDRLALLPQASQPEIRQLFSEYVNSRAGLFDILVDESAARAELLHSSQLQEQIWDRVVEVTQHEDYQPVRVLVLPALNQMFDISNVRTMAIQTHPPPMVLTVLFMVALGCAALVGYGANTQQPLSRVHSVGFALVVSFTLYVILDVEYARFGLVTLHEVNQQLIDFAQKITPE